ncbi:TPR-like protein [Ascodesmis nigricans]|uniref:TPR-like protein n=1 Tax=Ascodesmis nigricans TaxID=341454 RepID=A0A4S2MSP2_9PEZI|nr:TPR-like protein [Ascodesmis nigricans]
MAPPTNEAPAPEPEASSSPTMNGNAHTLPPDPPKEEIDGEAYKQAGNKFFKAGEYLKAVEEYTKAIDCEPSNATFFSNRAAAFMSAGKYHQALADCQRAERIDHNNPKTLLRMARIQVALGRPDDALETYDRITPAPSQKDRQAAVRMAQHIKSAQQSIEAGQGGSMVLHALDRAEESLGKGVEPPKKWRLLRGEAHLKLGNQNALGEAQNVAMAMLRQNPQDSDALVLRGRVLYAMGDNTKAAAHFQEALRCDPDMKQARIYLKRARELERKKSEGNDAFKRGDFVKAKELYGEALAVDPENKNLNSKIYNNRAMACNRNGLMPSPIANNPSSSIPRSPKLAKPSPNHTKVPVNGKKPSANSKPLRNPTHPMPLSRKKSVLPSWSSRRASARITTRSWGWRRMRMKHRSRRHTGKWPSSCIPTRTRIPRRLRNSSKISVKLTSVSLIPKSANAAAEALSSEAADSRAADSREGEAEARVSRASTFKLVTRSLGVGKHLSSGVDFRG